MMLMGHSMAQSVHLMQRSSSSRNIPRKRSEGSFFCSGYWIVVFFLKKCRPVTPSPSNRSSRTILSSHFRRDMRLPRLRQREPAPEAGEDEHQGEESRQGPAQGA